MQCYRSGFPTRRFSHRCVFTHPPGRPFSPGCFWVPRPSTPAAPRLLGTPRAVGRSPRERQRKLPAHPCPSAGPGDGAQGGRCAEGWETQELGGQQEKCECVRVWGQREEWDSALSLPLHGSGPVDLPTRRERRRIQLAWLGDRSHWARDERQACFKMRFKKITG